MRHRIRTGRRLVLRHDYRDRPGEETLQRCEFRRRLNNVKVWNACQCGCIPGRRLERRGCGEYWAYAAAQNAERIKYLAAKALPDEQAHTIANTLLTEWILRFGAPEKIHSDNGTNFVSEIVTKMCTLMKIGRSTTVPYHPQSDGMVEKANKTIIERLRTLGDAEHDWDELLPFVVSTYNNTVHATTRFSPNFLLFNRLVRDPTDVMLETAKEEALSLPDYVQRMKSVAEDAAAHAIQRVESSQRANKRQYDKRSTPQNWKVGDRVLVYTPRPGKKTARLQTGVYVIEGIDSAKSTVVCMPTALGQRKRIRAHFNQLTLANELVFDKPPTERRARGRPSKKNTVATRQQVSESESSDEEECVPMTTRQRAARANESAAAGCNEQSASEHMDDEHAEAVCVEPSVESDEHVEEESSAAEPAPTPPQVEEPTSSVSQPPQQRALPTIAEDEELPILEPVSTRVLRNTDSRRERQFSGIARKVRKAVPPRTAKPKARKAVPPQAEVREAAPPQAAKQKRGAKPHAPAPTNSATQSEDIPSWRRPPLIPVTHTRASSRLRAKPRVNYDEKSWK